MEFLELVKKETKERLQNQLDEFVYPCDIGFLITENENINGSWFNSAEEAKNFIKEYFDDFLEYRSWYKNVYGEVEYLDEDDDHGIEAVQCRMMICAIENCYESAFRKAYTDPVEEDDVWSGDKREVTQDFIDRINKAIDDVTEIF